MDQVPQERLPAPDGHGALAVLPSLLQLLRPQHRCHRRGAPQSPSLGTGRCPAHLRAFTGLKGRQFLQRVILIDAISAEGCAGPWDTAGAHGITLSLCLGRGSAQHVCSCATTVTSWPSQATLLAEDTPKTLWEPWESQQPFLSPRPRALSSAPQQPWNLPAARSHQRNFRIKMYPYHYLSE